MRFVFGPLTCELTAAHGLEGRDAGLLTVESVYGVGEAKAREVTASGGLQSRDRELLRVERLDAIQEPVACELTACTGLEADENATGFVHSSPSLSGCRRSCRLGRAFLLFRCSLARFLLLNTPALRLDSFSAPLAPLTQVDPRKRAASLSLESGNPRARLCSPLLFTRGV